MVKKASLESGHFGQDLSRSLSETGFAVVTDHGIEPELISETYEAWKKFFDKSLEEKLALAKDNNMGYIPFGLEKAKDAKIQDLKEMFHVFSPFVPEGVDQNTKELTIHLATKLTFLGYRLLDELQPYFEFSPTYQGQPDLGSIAEGSPSTLFRIINYPPLSPETPEGALRAAAHEDINLITLLPAATSPGLEVMATTGRWVAIDTDPGNIVINAGDMLQEYTGGLFASTKHRVVNPNSSLDRRLSMPLFVHPHPETVLSNRHTAQSYLDERLREIGLKK